MDQADSVLAPATHEEEPFKLKAIPVAIAIAMALGIAFLAFVTVEFLKLLVRLPEPPQMPWLGDYYYFGAQLLYALLAMRYLGIGTAADFGLRRPEGASLLNQAVKWGLVGGVLFTLIDYWPEILLMRRPEQPYPLTPLNIVGWVSYAGVFIGFAEEIFFRGLLLTYLTHAMPGRVTVRGLTMNGAGVVVAVIYAFSYAGSLLNKPFLFACLEITLAFWLGLVFAYWAEKSKSLLAPIVGHNVASLLEQILVFGMVAAWR